MLLRERVLFVLLALVLSAAAVPGSAVRSGVTWEESLEAASGGAYQGPWRMNQSVYDYVDDPAVAINEQGAMGVVWADQARKDIYFQLYSRDGKPQLEIPVNVSASPEVFSWLPRIVITSTDPVEVFILWQEIIFSGGSHGGDILFAASTDGGLSFSVPVNISNDMAGSGKGRISKEYWHNGSLDLAMGPEKNLYAAWTEYEGTLWFSRSTDLGAAFSPPLAVAGGQGFAPARGPSLAVSGDGTVFLAWTVGEDKEADIYSAKSVDQGLSFSEPRIAIASGGHSDAPKIAVDSRGTLHLVYAESPEGPLEQSHIEYTRLNAGEEVFAVPRNISDPQSGPFKTAGFPYLGLDGSDNLYILWELFAGPAVWELFPGPRNRPRGLGFTFSTDAGLTFAPPSVVPGTLDPGQGVNGSLQGLLMQKLAVNGAGEIAVVNSTFKENEASRVRLMRGRNFADEPGA